MMDWFEAAKPYLVHVHIKDHTGRTNGIEPRHLWPGEGVCCVVEILNNLRGMKYEGLLSIEPNMGVLPDPSTRMETFLEYGERMKRLVDA